MQREPRSRHLTIRRDTPVVMRRTLTFPARGLSFPPDSGTFRTRRIHRRAKDFSTPLLQGSGKADRRCAHRQRFSGFETAAFTRPRPLAFPRRRGAVILGFGVGITDCLLPPVQHRFMKGPSRSRQTRRHGETTLYAHVERARASRCKFDDMQHAKSRHLFFRGPGKQLTLLLPSIRTT